MMLLQERRGLRYGAGIVLEKAFTGIVHRQESIDKSEEGRRRSREARLLNQRDQQ
jgi:hypothetical protein